MKSSCPQLQLHCWRPSLFKTSVESQSAHTSNGKNSLGTPMICIIGIALFMQTAIAAVKQLHRNGFSFKGKLYQ